MVSPTTVATFSPPYDRANVVAARPAGSSEPDTIAAIVSRMCHIACSLA
jgi:hypothetical protein